MTNIKIMTWNIQNLGKKKSGFSDIMLNIAKVVIREEIDIFIILEINTTDIDTAQGIMRAMQETFYRASDDRSTQLAVDGEISPYWYSTWVLSPNVRKEFYGVFIKDTATVRPATTDVLEIGGGRIDISAARFTTWPKANSNAGSEGEIGMGQVPGVFPLYRPDLVLERERQSHQPTWNLNRLPCMGLFEINAASRYLLAVHICHYDTSKMGTKEQIEMLTAFRLVREKASVKVNGEIKALPHVIITGDFNIDKLDSEAIKLYKPLINLGYISSISDYTHLTTLTSFSDKKRNYFNACYDNFFLSPNVRNTSSKPKFKDSGIVDLILWMNRSVFDFRGSVDKYTELDQRGFDRANADAYADIARNVSDALKDPRTVGGNLSPWAKLVGARLISDHFPVTLTLNFGR